MGLSAQIRPTRPSTWLFGEAGGVQVWAAVGDPSVCAAVLIGQGAPVVILNERIVGTADEFAALSWALARVSRGESGFFVRRA